VWPLISAIAKRVRGGQSRAAGRFVLPEPTFAGIADALGASRSEKDSLKLQKWVGGIITPLEVAELMESSQRLPPQTQAWLSKLAELGELAAGPQRYRRQALVPNIDIYSDASIPADRKSLILGFGGAAGQLMIPTPVFLQYVPSDHYDVVVLRDRTKQGYAIGIPPYAHNLWDLAQKLTAEIGAATYRRVYPYGTSMGGFPALRCGLLLKTETAISAGGQFPWYPPHLARKVDVPAFDPLCACYANSKTKLICYHSAGYLPDVQSTELLQRILPIERVPIEAPGHAFLAQLWSEGKLRGFYDRIFGVESEQAPTAPARKADQVA
jgi:hypothetical protein